MEKSFLRNSCPTFFYSPECRHSLKSLILISFLHRVVLAWFAGLEELRWHSWTSAIYIIAWKKSTVQDLPKMEFKAKKSNSNNKSRLTLLTFLQSLTIRFKFYLFSKADVKWPPVTFCHKCCFLCYPWELSAFWIKKKQYSIRGSDCFIQQSTRYKLVNSWNLMALLVLSLSLFFRNR